ncbi:putative membrane protein DUF2339 [Mariniflexile fucanivorans]|uniref:Putative membrane protein DUF2339 n=1 Tax=Mariniflexile fucanivorans TaxID=264023 RepID=A0A4R1RNF2_9FLAO|nr:DUF2339 domain-containing protein [Mariniflexile fucanivorans]TCL67756.1 putative membrane protein DUF2339 [Mariniflexile fucanivorans]
MEGFLLIIILILLVIILSKNGSHYKEINNSIDGLHQKLNQLRKDLSSLENSSVKAKEDVKPATKAEPIIIIKPVEEKPIIIPPKPIIADAISKPIPVPKPAPAPEPVKSKEPVIPKKSWYETFKENNPDLEKFIGENLINKIGILILVLGISFFVKYAIDKNWINEYARVGIGILCGSLVMGIAHKLKKNYAAFSSVMVAGAISIFYFTIAIAFHEYQLFNQTVAFVIMVVITAFSVLISVAYNRQELAVLSLIGGFAVPFMVSTGSGNYMVLFTYIAILNIGILAISYFKKWKVVTILSFIFTTLLFFSWVVKELMNDTLPHAGALTFATLFYFIFSIIIVLNNLRNKGTFSIIEYGILIANTFFFFGIGLTIIHDWELQIKGVFTLSLAVYNLVYAIILYKKFGLDKNAIYLLIGLTLTFVTLTIPIQFKGNYITLFWAAEAVLLFWLSQKSKINGFKYGAIIVQGLSIISLMIDWVQKYDMYNETTLQIILNPIFITGIVVVAALIATYFIIKKETVNFKVLGFELNLSLYKNLLLVAAIGIGYLVGILEIIYQSNQYIANQASALSFAVAYHFVFSSILLFFGLRSKNIQFTKVTLLLAMVNIVFYILFFYKLSSNEMASNYNLETNYNYAFLFHYVILACLIYFGISLLNHAKEKPVFSFLQSKIALWIFAFAMVYVFSNEIIVHSIKLTPQLVDVTELNTNYPTQTTNDTYYDDYGRTSFINSEFNDVKRQIIKIGYPILWGFLSFVFLIIGIKRQWKQLRIIALSLLGITIIKLFVYDINNVSETGKIIAFILLGVLVLVISFVYQKIKKLVVDTDASKNPDTNV